MSLETHTISRGSSNRGGTASHLLEQIVSLAVNSRRALVAI